MLQKLITTAPITCKHNNAQHAREVLVEAQCCGSKVQQCVQHVLQRRPQLRIKLLPANPRVSSSYMPPSCQRTACTGDARRLPP